MYQNEVRRNRSTEICAARSKAQRSAASIANPDGLSASRGCLNLDGVTAGKFFISKLLTEANLLDLGQSCL
jgi:hypothetical protein